MLLANKIIADILNNPNLTKGEIDGRLKIALLDISAMSALVLTIIKNSQQSKFIGFTKDQGRWLFAEHRRFPTCANH